MRSPAAGATRLILNSVVRTPAPGGMRLSAAYPAAESAIAATAPAWVNPCCCEVAPVGRMAISTTPDETCSRVAPRVFMKPCLAKLDRMRSWWPSPSAMRHLTAETVSANLVLVSGIVVIREAARCYDGRMLGRDRKGVRRKPDPTPDPTYLHDRGFGVADETELAADAVFDGAADIRVLLEELLRVLAALAQTLAAVREPRARLLDDPLVDREIDEIAGARDAFTVHHVELGLAERWRDLVLHHLDPRATADHGVAVLDARDAADVEPDRRVELERAPARGRFGVAEHDADLLAQLVDEDEARLRLGDDAGELAERLRHEAGLQAHLRFAHLAFDFRPRHERRDRVDDDDVDAARTDEDLDDFERLLAVVGLRDEEVLEIDAEFLRILRVESMLGVDEGRHAALLLRLGDDLQRERGLARRLRTEHLDDAAAWDAADAEGIVEADGAGRDRGDLRDDILGAQAHDRALAELLFDLADGHFDGLEALAIVTVFYCHGCSCVSDEGFRRRCVHCREAPERCQAKTSSAVLSSLMYDSDLPSFVTFASFAKVCRFRDRCGASIPHILQSERSP